MELYGIVVCGGRSSRMGSDKSVLDYHGKPQYQHVAEMLGPFCQKVVISCNSAQLHTFDTAFTKMPDATEYAGSGPIAALLTAFQNFLGHNFLLIGCDYPLLTARDIAAFLDIIHENQPAAAFYNQHEKYEPLLAWYSGGIAPALRAHYLKNNHSLQSLLHQLNAYKHTSFSAEAILSADTPQDFEQIKAIIDNYETN